MQGSGTPVSLLFCFRRIFCLIFIVNVEQIQCYDRPPRKINLRASAYPCKGPRYRGSRKISIFYGFRTIDWLPYLNTLKWLLKQAISAILEGLKLRFFPVEPVPGPPNVCPSIPHDWPPAFENVSRFMILVLSRKYTTDSFAPTFLIYFKSRS